MVTLYQNPSLANEQADGDASSPHQPGEAPSGYNTYIEPDTKIPPKAQPVLPEISVNSVKIAEADILEEAQQHPATNPGEALKEAAHALVVRELLLQEAVSLGVEATPQTDDAGKSETEIDARIRALIAQEVSTPDTTKEECHRYYDNNPDRFYSETIYEARHILLPFRENKPGSPDESEAQAKDLVAHLQQKPDEFAVLAKEFSVCPSKEQDGNLGQITRGSTVSEFEDVLVKMDSGTLWPEPVKSRFGWHIIILDRKIPGEILPFDYVEERISAWLEASSWSRAVSQYITILAGKANIQGISLGGTDDPLVQ